jgi:hypothetical protein
MILKATNKKIKEKKDTPGNYICKVKWMICSVN